MAPNVASDQTGPLYEEENVDTEVVASKNIAPKDRKLQLVWWNIILFGYLHLAALYGLYLCFTSAKILTTISAIFLYKIGILGITAGAHRLWSHRSYKAKLPLRIFLVFCNCLAFQDAVVDWARNHRVHHKYTETDADPHNAKRGFFFSHIGWLLCRKHPDVKTKGKGIDLSDLYADPVLRYQKKYYFILMPLACFITPTFIPWYFWGETLHNSWFVTTLLRYCLTLNITWLVNSAAHIWGLHPFDKYIHPSENLLVSLLAVGEGWHNYHHTFPWDYKTSELGKYATNETTLFINLMAKLGLAYDLKSVPEEIVKKRVLRTGDGSHRTWGNHNHNHNHDHDHHHNHNHHENASWGWGDKDQTRQERETAIIIAPKQE